MINGAISVIIPAYNRAGLIGETLRSLLNQTLPADEIIVVDDGSTDGTAEAVLEMLKLGNTEKLKISGGKPWPEFKVVRQANAGPGAARNRGFAESKGEFIHFFDSDDIAAPNKHEVQVRALQESGADIAYGPWVKGRIAVVEKLQSEKADTLKPATSRPSPVTWHFVPEGHVLQQKGLPKGDLIKELLTRWSIVPQACLFRRSILDKSGGFPPQMFAAEDQVLFLRCLLHGAKVAHSPGTVTFYRLGHEGKLTESAEGHRRCIRDWARYLIIAAEEISSFQHVSASASQCFQNSSRWFGFRQRCWSALRDLKAAGEGTGEEARRLAELTHGGPPEPASAALATLQRWRGGIQARLTGSREDASFRTGPMTAEQTTLFPSMADGE
jgi:glycosyltransferase involved in cell wall biosynthesis